LQAFIITITPGSVEKQCKF